MSKRSDYEDDYYVEPTMVGSAYSDWGPLEEPKRRPWQRKPKPKKKPTFGFARALETE